MEKTAMIMATPATAATAPRAIVRVLLAEVCVCEFKLPSDAPVDAVEVVPVRVAGEVEPPVLPAEVVSAVFSAGNAAVKPFDVQYPA